MKQPYFAALRRRSLATIGLLVSLCMLGLSGCDSGSDSDSDDTEERSLRLVNAVVGSTYIGWEINESDQGTVYFGRASTAQALINGDKPLTFYLVQADGDYEYLDLAFDYELYGDQDVLIVLYGTLDDISYEIIEVDTFDEDEDLGQVGFLNLTSAYDAVDLYLTDDEDGIYGASPTVSSQVGVFSGMEYVDEGDYALRFTETGDKTEIFDAGDVEIDEDSNHFYLMMDFYSGSDELLVLEIVSDDTSRQLVSDDSTGQLRFFNAIADYVSVDVYLGSTSGEPLFMGQGFQSITDFAELEPDTYSLNITPEGVLDTFLFEGEVDVVAGSYTTLVVAGSVLNDDIGGNAIADIVQPVTSGALVSFVHASTSNDDVDVYLLLPGQPTTDTVPIVSDLSPFLSYDFVEDEGEFQIVLIQSSNDAVVLGPVPVSFEAGSIYEIFFTDTEGGGTPGAITVVETASE